MHGRGNGAGKANALILCIHLRSCLTYTPNFGGPCFFFLAWDRKCFEMNREEIEKRMDEPRDSTERRRRTSQSGA
jgi:hypothetical protein